MKDNLIIRKVSVRSGAISGFIASLISSIVLIILTALIVIPQFNYVSIYGSLVGVTDNAIAAWIVYFIIGTFVWGILYAFTHEYLPDENFVTKGMVFGLAVWVFLMIILMPLAGQSVFLREFGYSAAGITLIAQLIFGIVLAWTYEKI